MDAKISKPPQNKRIIGYDVARALAVFGMVLVNFKVVMGAAGSGPVWLDGLMSLLEGRAAAVFVVLAGVGITLMTNKGRQFGSLDRQRSDRTTLLKRALFLFVVGLAYIPIWPADILHFYGVYLAIAAFVFTASDRRLWTGAVFSTLMFVVLLMLFDYEAGWNWETLEYSGFWTPAGMLRHLFFNGFHPVFPWLSFLLIGMWLGRQNVREPATRCRILGISLVVALLTEAVSLVLTTRFFSGDLGALFDTVPIPPMPLYIVAGASTAIVVILLCLEATQRNPEARWATPLVHTGQLALTLYVAHVLIGMGFLETIGRLEQQNLVFAVTSGLIFCVLSVLFAHFWRLRYKRGPLEWVMRRLTA
jgi:uncharacterized membrane protein YeiB